MEKEKEEFQLNSNTRKWLIEHGGRNVDEDLRKDDKGLYVLMGNGYGGDTKVYLPKE